MTDDHHRRPDDSSVGDRDESAVPRRRRWVRVAVGVAVALVVVVLGSVVHTAWSVVRASDAGWVSGSGPVDALVVFAGEERRVELALELVDAGVAPVVVFSHGDREPLVAGRCGSVVPVEVLCPVPVPSDTRGEARMFADLAVERGWGRVVAVTGNYHLARARMLMSRCFAGEARFEVVDWDDVPLGVWWSETVKSWHTRYIDRGC